MEIALLINGMVLKRHREARSVHGGLLLRAWIHDIEGALCVVAMVQYVELWLRLRHIIFSDTRDTLT